ncbi:MAG: SUMF1/EgtB/PvdO family nonheme iron enzyme [Bacteroidetes bacterium]|nr:SUMF1/EgtB/PvdO family nonheme iron enzyme [Bacteroidota bacterium]
MPGFYNVVVVDAIGVIDSVSFEIGVLSGGNILAIQVNSTVASTPYTADGTATAIVNGGVPPYTYAWSNGGTGPNIFNLLPGNYSLTVYDSQNNYGSKNFSVGIDPIFPIIQWVSIPAGTFTMGSPSFESDRGSNEGPQHSVTLSGFKMSKLEVTFAQYDAFCDATGRTKPSDEGWGRGNRPVINVDWNDATAFAQWMGCRLPTEAEWEYACRAGTTSPFNTGSCLSSSEANYDGNYPYSTCAQGTFLGKPQPAGSYAPNAWGLYDMHGNVWEWCSDWYGGYSSGAQTNPEGPSSGSDRVLRGGGWRAYSAACRSAGRGAGFPSYRTNDWGFRLVVPN